MSAPILEAGLLLFSCHEQQGKEFTRKVKQSLEMACKFLVAIYTLGVLTATHTVRNSSPGSDGYESTLFPFLQLPLPFDANVDILPYPVDHSEWYSEHCAVWLGPFSASLTIY